MTEKKKVGFIGLGIMGRPMAKNLVKAGYRLVVHDINPAPVEELVSLGQEAARSPREVAERTDVIITMLPNSPDVKQVILGPDGVLEGARPGSMIIDMSSIAPLVSIEVAQRAREKGVRMMDAPVSGGEPGAIAGTLSIMVGGDPKDFEEYKELLSHMGKSVVRIGDVGSGNMAKLANQIIVALNIAAVSEALVLAKKAGVSPKLVYEAIRGGLAGSTVLDAKAPLMMQRKFEPGFKIDLHIKDLANVIDTARQVGVPLPLTAVVMEILQALKVDGKGQNDHGAIVNFYEKLAKVEVTE
ncbi:MAG TPA: 2-hydroxy-3-oxopropionate reductase [Firmicutes bacterium]|nr:2-hydroxy-3-oxopropionate reductase [Bacillota bacterium]